MNAEIVFTELSDDLRCARAGCRLMIVLNAIIGSNNNNVQNPTVKNDFLVFIENKKAVFIYDLWL